MTAARHTRAEFLALPGPRRRDPIAAAGDSLDRGQSGRAQDESGDRVARGASPRDAALHADL